MGHSVVVFRVGLNVNSDDSVLVETRHFRLNLCYFGGDFDSFYIVQQ